MQDGEGTRNNPGGRWHTGGILLATDANLDSDLTCLSKVERQRKALALDEVLLQTAQHEVHGPRLQANCGAGRDDDGIDRVHDTLTVFELRGV
jgi:hypothetical protein